MKLNRREMILAGVTGGLLLVLLVFVLFFLGDSRSMEKLFDERKAKQADVDKKEKVVNDAKRDAKRLVEWRRRSLPATASPSDAPSMYQDWLRALAKQANIDHLKIDPPKESGPRRVDPKDAVAKPEFFAYTLHGQATLADLTRFLYDFYSAGHLHQIRSMTLKPRENTRELEATITIEAVEMPDADRKDALSKEPPIHALHHAKLDEYRELITKRNLFVAYAPTEVKSVDPAEYTFVTGITEVNGKRQLWLFDRMAGKKWILGEGESFQVGGTQGTVKTIASTREATVEFDGRSRVLHEGENLRGGERARGERMWGGPTADDASRSADDLPQRMRRGHRERPREN
jgi:hypothetical protein